MKQILDLKRDKWKNTVSSTCYRLIKRKAWIFFFHKNADLYQPQKSFVKDLKERSNIGGGGGGGRLKLIKYRGVSRTRIGIHLTHHISILDIFGNLGYKSTRMKVILNFLMHWSWGVLKKLYWCVFDAKN